MESVISLLFLPLQIIKAAYRILAHRTLLLLCLVPYGVGILTFIASVSLGFAYRDEFAAFTIGTASGWLAQIIAYGFVLVNFLLSGILSLVVVIAFCGFFVEEFVAVILVEKGLKQETPFTFSFFIESTIRGLFDGIKRVLSLGIFGVILFIAGFFPPLYIPALLIGAWLVGVDLLDMPLRLLEIPFRERFKALKAHKLECLAFGAYFSAILIIPFAGIFLLPLFQWVACQSVDGWPETRAALSSRKVG